MVSLSPDTITALRAALEAELPAAIELRALLHADPEPSGAEWRTAARVADAIGMGGMGEMTTVAETGRLIRVGTAGAPCVAVRGELDALPGPEEGFLHACGHDVHLAALTALARAVGSLDLPVSLLAMLQPREEHPPSGARDIVAAKALEAHDVRAVIGAHLQPLLARGTVAATVGAVNAASDEFEIVVTGRGGHGGYPHLTRDPVVALAQVIVAAQQLVSRRIDPLHPAVLTVGSVRAGSAPNVIPDQACAQGTLRFLDEADRAPAHEELAAIVASVAAACGCRGDVRIHEGEPALVNDAALTEDSHAWLQRLGFEIAPPLRSCGADDFSYYGAVAPSLMMFVGVDQEYDGRRVMLHQPVFDPPDSAVHDVAFAMLGGYLAAVQGVSA